MSFVYPYCSCNKILLVNYINVIKGINEDAKTYALHSLLPHPSTINITD